uniref:NADH:ubiquinone reductase (H(+)-translocating) n=1 Tax=Steinernema carpocapsae TaxID=34508 RepID=Q6PNA4_STECR|nr:NADH dehydrogenase subunit 5 [Steinernema carpocapsae]AAT00533.1 NADH dehydrogenase subunit 5 [Steinernema carpocapsae]
MSICVYLIFFCFFFFLMFFLMFFNFKLSFFFFDWSFLSLKFNFYFNSILFSFILLVVTLSVLVFSTYYLDGELNFNYYYFVLLIFVGSMFSLNFSNSVFTMLISWDILGISSFFLVLFYNNWDSCSGAMNTVLTNRLGDFFIFFFFSFSFFSSFYFLSLSFFVCFSSLMLILTAFTKSAQFPFSGWLPKAMSAPTPVSSLVHSSTLVTAGLILIMNFSEIVFNINISQIILLIGIFTMFFSSITALVEEDMKKVVALSTLSQMGFSMLTIGLGLSFVSFTHLVSHALFKSCLFMQVGYMIHCSFGQQDGRGYNNLGNIPVFIQLQLLVTLFCLCGLFFSSGAVSKDFILEIFFSNSFMFFFCFMFFISVFFTFGYSYRLWKSFFLNFSSSVNNFSSGFVMNFLSFFLVFFSIVFLWWMNLNIMFLPSFFLYMDFFVPIFFLFFFVFVFFLNLKVMLMELIYKFSVDFLPKYSLLLMKSTKFSENFFTSFNSKGFSFFSFLNFFFNSSMKGLNFNSIVIVIIVLFIFF